MGRRRCSATLSSNSCPPPIMSWSPMTMTVLPPSPPLPLPPPLPPRRHRPRTAPFRQASTHGDRSGPLPSRQARPVGVPGGALAPMALHLGYVNGTGQGSEGFGIDQFAKYWMPASTCVDTGAPCDHDGDCDHARPARATGCGAAVVRRWMRETRLAGATACTRKDLLGRETILHRRVPERPQAHITCTSSGSRRLV